MARSIQIVRVAPHGRNSLVLQWQLAEELRSIGSVTFKIELSGSPMGPWELVAENIVDTFVYEDINFKTYSMLKDKYYRVSSQDGEFVSDPHPVRGSMRSRQFLVWRKILNDETVMLKKGNGVQIAIVKRRHWGEKCTCIDQKTGLIVKPDCDTCKGTKYIGGYFSPTFTWGNIQPSTVGTDRGAPGSVPEIETSQGFILSFPLIFKDDILVEMDTNKRWLVVSAKPTELQRNAVHQDIVLSRLPEADEAYKVDIQWPYHKQVP